MNKSVVLLSVVAIALPVAAIAGGESITIPKKIAFTKSANVPDAVRKECNLESEAASAISKALTDAGYKVTQAGQVSKGTKGKALELHITGMMGHGGPFAPKKLDIDGVLYNNGKTVGSFHDVRNTTHGRGVCGMLVRDAEEIGEDIAKWLKEPKAKSKLGDAS